MNTPRCSSTTNSWPSPLSSHHFHFEPSVKPRCLSFALNWIIRRSCPVPQAALTNSCCLPALPREHSVIYDFHAPQHIAVILEAHSDTKAFECSDQIRDDCHMQSIRRQFNVSLSRLWGTCLLTNSECGHFDRIEAGNEWHNRTGGYKA